MCKGGARQAFESLLFYKKNNKPQDLQHDNETFSKVINPVTSTHHDFMQ